MSIVQKDLLDIDYPEEELPTFGDLTIDKKGNKIPIEQKMTHELEWGSLQGLDYIFHFDDKDKPQNQDKTLQIVKGSSKIEKFFAKDLVKLKIIADEVRMPRPYVQLSDHYGVSCNIKICNK